MKYVYCQSVYFNWYIGALVATHIHTHTHTRYLANYCCIVVKYLCVCIYSWPLLTKQNKTDLRHTVVQLYILIETTATSLSELTHVFTKMLDN